MRTFTDANGRTWDLAINVGGYQDVRSQLKIDLTKLLHDRCRGLKELLEDLGKLVDVLYVLCRQQCGERAMSDIDFGRSFDGATIEAASAAFLQEMADFFPNRKVREVMKDLLKKGEEATAEMERRLEQEAAKVTSETILAAMEADGKSKAEKSTASSIEPPASAGSIRGL